MCRGKSMLPIEKSLDLPRDYSKISWLIQSSCIYFFVSVGCKTQLKEKDLLWLRVDTCVWLGYTVLELKRESS